MTLTERSNKRDRAAHVWERDPFDWYVEPTRVTEQLLTVERFVGSIWDPACGQGNIIKTLRAAGHDAFGTDVVRRAGNPDWFAGECDFLRGDARDAVNVVTNPPFFRAKGTEAFIRHALAVVKGKVAVFTDIKFLASASRGEGLFREHPPHRIWILSNRPSCPPGAYLAAGNEAGGGTADWCWLVWDRPETRIGWLTGAAQ
jgi:hypothetical protein